MVRYLFLPYVLIDVRYGKRDMVHIVSFSLACVACEKTSTRKNKARPSHARHTPVKQLTRGGYYILLLYVPYRTSSTYGNNKYRTIIK